MAERAADNFAVIRARIRALRSEAGLGRLCRLRDGGGPVTSCWCMTAGLDGHAVLCPPRWPPPAHPPEMPERRAVFELTSVPWFTGRKV